MGLFIGNLTNSESTLKYVNNITLSNHKVWGVTFNFYGTSPIGIRLYDAVGLDWGASHIGYVGADDFIMTNNGDSPFHIRKCVREYDATSKTEKYTFKDTDPTGYAALVANKTGARMIAFPKFYYKRPQVSTFLVSNDPIDGFLPSPMHYKRPVSGGDKVMSDYVYVSEFMYGSGGASQPGTPIGGLTAASCRDVASSFGMRNEDIETRMMINILLMIKYANVTPWLLIGNGANEYQFGVGESSWSMNESDWDCEFDGYQTNLTSMLPIKCMGLIDWYGNRFEFIDNINSNNSGIYVTESKHIEPITTYAELSATGSGWDNTGISVSHSGFYSFENNAAYPYLLTPSNNTNGSLTIDACITIGSLGAAMMGSGFVGYGPFFLYTTPLTEHGVNMGARFIV